MDDLAAPEAIGLIGPDRIPPRSAVDGVRMPVGHVDQVVAGTGEDHVTFTEGALDHIGSPGSAKLAGAGQGAHAATVVGADADVPPTAVTPGSDSHGRARP